MSICYKIIVRCGDSLFNLNNALVSGCDRGWDGRTDTEVIRGLIAGEIRFRCGHFPPYPSQELLNFLKQDLLEDYVVLPCSGYHDIIDAIVVTDKMLRCLLKNQFTKQLAKYLLNDDGAAHKKAFFESITYGDFQKNIVQECITNNWHLFLYRMKSAEELDERLTALQYVPNARQLTEISVFGGKFHEVIHKHHVRGVAPIVQPVIRPIVQPVIQPHISPTCDFTFIENAAGANRPSELKTHLAGYVAGSCPEFEEELCIVALVNQRVKVLKVLLEAGFLGETIPKSIFQELAPIFQGAKKANPASLLLMSHFLG